jgi:beta-1,2-mannobiose phosphorylase / 1,2-beta-oligomannan phosphorylase
MENIFKIIFLCLLLSGCAKKVATSEDAIEAGDSSLYATEILDFSAYEGNPVFKGTGSTTWDEKIRERGFIIRENGTYHMWYTGFRDRPDAEMHLGYATSDDGISWKRFEGNPVFDSGWVEDMMVVKSGDTYYMFAEGKDDIAHLLTSQDRVQWTEHGALDIRYVTGEPLTKGAYGTPAAWEEDGIWYLFYERGDLGIWLATSTDLKRWTNVQDGPVIQIGPEAYDKYGVAVNQVIKYKGKYYAYYHATAYEDWHEWSSCVAISEDLIHWTKYKGNPIMGENKSSPILVDDGERYRLYTMHEEVCVHFSTQN